VRGRRERGLIGQIGARCRIGFTTLLPELLQKQSIVVLLLDGALVYWSLARDEHGGHEGLRGLGRQSVIPYIHGRTELYYAQVCLA
jgi:hypothetical protein